MGSRIVPLNPQRIEEGVWQNLERTKRDLLAAGSVNGCSVLAGTVPKGDPEVRCALCGKDPAKQDREFGWECSHVDCPCRRKCWSNGTGPKPWRPETTTDPLGPLFDRVD